MNLFEQVTKKYKDRIELAERREEARQEQEEKKEELRQKLHDDLSASIKVYDDEASHSNLEERFSEIEVLSINKKISRMKMQKKKKERRKNGKSRRKNG